MTHVTFDLFNFYVLCGEPLTPKLLKVPLERDLQQELTVHLDSLRSLFRDSKSECVPYDPGYRPEPGELFKVPEFRLPAALKALSVSAPTLRAVDDATLESERVRALVGAGTGPRNSEPLLVFQAIDARQVLRREGFAFLLSDRVFRRNDRAGLVVRDALDAVFEDGALYFASEYVARRFLDLSGLFEEATKPELLRFFSQEAFFVEDPSRLESLCDQWARRKIKMLQIDRALERLNLTELLEHAESFQVKLTLRDNRLVIPRQKKDFKLLLRFLDEDFLESALSQSRYLANSKRRISSLEARRVEPARQGSQSKLRVARGRLAEDAASKPDK